MEDKKECGTEGCNLDDMDTSKCGEECKADAEHLKTCDKKKHCCNEACTDQECCSYKIHCCKCYACHECQDGKECADKECKDGEECTDEECKKECEHLKSCDKKHCCDDDCKDSECCAFKIKCCEDKCHECNA